MIRHCMACQREITACNGFGLARDVIACQDGVRTKFPRELCGVCVERASRDREWFIELEQETA